MKIVISNQLSVTRRTIVKESFENFNCWIKAKELCLQIYKLIEKFPKEERFGLSDQLRRAGVSIPSNIAEGLSRKTSLDQLHFFDISVGSVFEAMTQLDIAKELNYISEQEKQTAFSKSSEVLKLINGYKNYKRNNGKKTEN